MPRKARSKHHDDRTIDLTERLAPYSGSSLSPKPRPLKDDEPAELVEALWTPLEFEFPYDAPEPPRGS